MCGTENVFYHLIENRYITNEFNQTVPKLLKQDRSVVTEGVKQHVSAHDGASKVIPFHSWK